MYRGPWCMKEQFLNDCESIGWEPSNNAHYQKSRQVASLEWRSRQAKSGRIFRESIRSITTTGKNDRRSPRPHFQQVDLDLNEIADIGTPPSQSVPGWLDYQVWIDGSVPRGGKSPTPFQWAKLRQAYQGWRACLKVVSAGCGVNSCSTGTSSRAKKTDDHSPIPGFHRGSGFLCLYSP